MQLCKPRPTFRSAKGGRTSNILRNDCGRYSFKCSPAGHHHHNMAEARDSTVNNKGGAGWEVLDLCLLLRIRMEDRMEVMITEILVQADTVMVVLVLCLQGLPLQMRDPSNLFRKHDPISPSLVTVTRPDDSRGTSMANPSQI